MTVYNDYAKAKEGLLWGQNGWKIVTISLGVLPVFAAVNRTAWFSALLLAAIWGLVTILLVVPVRGRTATGWLTAIIAFSVGGLMRVTSFRSRAARGDFSQPATVVDLPGVLSPIDIHEGPPLGAAQSRVAIIKNHATKSWSVTAGVVHPGIGMEDAATRDRYGRALSGLLDACEATEMISTIAFMVRTVPDDGAERRHWLEANRSVDGPELSRRVNDDLLATSAQASVRTEQFVTITIPERRITRYAKEAGGGHSGRAVILYNLMSEVESHLRGGMGMTRVAWLTSPELFLAVRTGFAPGDRAGLIDELRRDGIESAARAGVDWAVAGPSGADSAVRHYSHDAWNSVSATVRLPDKGALMGALAPVLMPSVEGERRSFSVVYPILEHRMATRQANKATTGASTAEGFRAKLRMNARAKERMNAEKARGLDEKLARGNSLVNPYAVCTVTVPKTRRVSHHGQTLDASVRRAGFNPLRLDIAQDVGFATSTIPLGIDLGGPRA